MYFPLRSWESKQIIKWPCRVAIHFRYILWHWAGINILRGNDLFIDIVAVVSHYYHPYLIATASFLFRATHPYPIATASFLFRATSN